MLFKSKQENGVLLFAQSEGLALGRESVEHSAGFRMARKKLLKLYPVARHLKPLPLDVPGHLEQLVAQSFLQTVTH